MSTPHGNPSDILILGAGPAGLMCAYLAVARGRRVRLIDKAARIGGKLPLTGGGKCNFTNRNVAPEHFIGSNPDFVRS
ncbi:MAG TPA: FAD-dependent oxidoreductase, partial [Phycisphaerales bacterium]|nr:FAD-dependent oxidoreductase [Phycisphaerales bacterium]